MQKRGALAPTDRKSTLRLAAVAWPFIAIIVIQAALATFSLQMVTSLRAYVTGESLWSKGQIDATYFLNRYIDTANPAFLVRYRLSIDVPWGDRDARLALDKQPPDVEAARAGFLRGGNHPADVPGLIWIYQNFAWFSYMQRAVADWRNAEPLLEQLDILAVEVASTNNPSAAQRSAWKSRLDGVKDLIRPLAVDFSDTLGQGTRFVLSALLAANLTMAAAFVVLTLWRLSNFIRHRRRIEHELSWRASHDDLTKLPNRAAFERAVEQGLGDGSARALLFVDLDQFKVVNDSGGHAAGDQLLRLLAETIPTTLCENALLARLGGDEFGVLISDVVDEAALSCAYRLRLVLSELPFIWDDKHFAVSASIGFVKLGAANETLQGVMRDADIACYMAKEKGRNRVHIHSPDDTEQAEMTGNIGWVQRLQGALDENRFVLYAQDIVPVGPNADGAHCEILVRLADRGELVAPGRFIPAAERFGLMPQLDRWVVRNALEVIAGRLALDQGAARCTFSINLSGATFCDETFLSFLNEVFVATRVPPQMVCFEITETSAVANLERAAAFIKALRGIGCRFALDDFGAGMSSFHYLKRLPVDYLKIDGGFVRNMLRDSTDRAVVETINHLGHITGIRTVAEFVESAEVLAALRGIGVDYAQGYYMGIPERFTERVAAKPEMEQRLRA